MLKGLYSEQRQAQTVKDELRCYLTFCLTILSHSTLIGVVVELGHGIYGECGRLTYHTGPRL